MLTARAFDYSFLDANRAEHQILYATDVSSVGQLVFVNDGESLSTIAETSIRDIVDGKMPDIIVRKEKIEYAYPANVLGPVQTMLETLYCDPKLSIDPAKLHRIATGIGKTWIGVVKSLVRAEHSLGFGSTRIFKKDGYTVRASVVFFRVKDDRVEFSI